VEPKTDLERLAELAQIWRKLARLHGADPDGPWGALLSPVASEAWGPVSYTHLTLPTIYSV